MAVTTEVENTTVPANVEQSDWSFFELSTIASPHSRIVLHDFEAATHRVVVDERCWLGRATLRPHHNDAILYCHEGAYNFVDARMWLVNADGSDVRCVSASTAGDIVVGEHWLADGSGIGYLHRSVPEGGEGALDLDLSEQGGLSVASCEAFGAGSIRVVDFETLEERASMIVHPYAHLAGSGDLRFCVGDGAGGSVPLHLLDESSAAFFDAADDYVYLADVPHRREVRLCRHASSWSSRHGTTQDAHPHPVVSSDCRSVLFVSDREGHPAIYRVDLARFVWERDAGDGVREREASAVDLGWGFPATFGDAACDGPAKRGARKKKTG